MGGLAARRLAVAVLLLSAYPPGRLAAQCPDGAPPPCSRAPAGPGARSVAVLNFRLLSRDSSDAYLAEGLADAVTSRLSQVGRLDVASRTAARLGRTPRAAFVVSGTMLRQNQRLIVNVELLRAATGRNTWAQRYERPDTAVLGLERDIAVAVASAMLPNVTAAERGVLGAGAARDPEAYDRLMRGNFLLAQRTPSSVARAIQEYEAAARLDPTFAAAHARIALATSIWMDWQWDPAGRPAPDSLLARGLAAAERAVALDSMSSDAWLAKAYVTIFALPRTFEGVEAAFHRALALDQRNAEAHHQYGDWLSIVSRDEEMRRHLRLALDIDPLRVVTLLNLGSSDSAAAFQALIDSAGRLEPDNPRMRYARAWNRVARGDIAAARADVDAALRHTAPEAMLEMLALTAQFRWHTGDTAGAIAERSRALAMLAPTGPLGTRTLALARTLWETGLHDDAMALLERVRPRAALLWYTVMNRQTDLSQLPERVRTVLEEARPPWIR